MQKLTDEVYGNLFVTSDTHFGHDKEFVYKARGYNNPQEMNEDMISIINKTVGVNGILLHLGDFCLNTTYTEYQDILSRLKVKEIWMLWGNHNNPIQRSYGGTREQVCAWNRGIFIRYLGHYFTFRKGKKAFVCSHFPLQVWDAANDNSMHIHGHCHGNLVTSLVEHKVGKILDVGWDVHSKPLTMNEIESIMNSKQNNLPHHD